MVDTRLPHYRCTATKLKRVKRVRKDSCCIARTHAFMLEKHGVMWQN